MGTVVKNRHGHRTNPACSCNTFLCHWENYSNRKARVCSAKGCGNSENLVGGHIIKCHGNANRTEYIVPLCPTCNNYANDECFELKDSAILVPVTARNRCERCD